jgi:hypothetical protein
MTVRGTARNSRDPGPLLACSRREFLAYASIFGWLPFLRPKHISLAGARFRIIRNGRSSRRYCVIHGNEETARQVLTAHIRVHEGRAFIIEGTTRDVSIEDGQIDPNRMFSRTGAEADLRRLNPGWTTDQVNAALAVLDHGREKLLKEFLPPDNGLFVALHNNSEAYSVADEEPISDAASIRDPDNPHAFFLCTDADDFRRLAASPYNVVFQHNAPRQDDGSLSRLAAGRGVRYMNVEVAMGQAGRQKEMLDWLEWNVP